MNGIDGPPFEFSGLKRGNNESMNAFPPLLKMVTNTDNVG